MKISKFLSRNWIQIGFWAAVLILVGPSVWQRDPLSVFGIILGLPFGLLFSSFVDRLLR